MQLAASTISQRWSSLSR